MPIDRSSKCGEPKLREIHSVRFKGNHTQDFYDTNWHKTQLEQYDLPKSDFIMDKPVSLEKMLSFSKKLAASLPMLE